MPSYAYSTLDHESKPHQAADDVFTRLSLANCGHDSGQRPLTCGCPGWLSPAFEFSRFPLPVREMIEVYLKVQNFGSSDACGVLLEVAYNLWIGNEAEAMLPIATQVLPIIPSVGNHRATVPWTPPDTTSTHACVHARVSDAYSMLNYPERTTSWDSFTNPQAASRNVTLVPITDHTEAVVVLYQARNFGKATSLLARTLVTEMDQRSQFRDPTSRHPLPFVPETLLPLALKGMNTNRPELAIGVPQGAIPGDSSLIVGGLRQPKVSLDGLWPTEKVLPEFIHGRYGFDVEDRLAESELGRIGRGFARLDTRPLLPLRSLHEFVIKAGSDRSIRFIVPKEQFPPPGQRKVFRLQYQKGTARPVEHFIYISR